MQLFMTTINEIKNAILTNYSNRFPIDYGLVHYYENRDAIISWHSDKEALKSNVYSISIGGTRCFCLREKNTKKVVSFNLFDGDLFVMKIGCQDKYEHCIKSIHEFNDPRISITFRQLEEPSLDI
jgi:alkylated DNA repair dioxygenase AlkB